jgi:transposase-like protein
VSFCLTAGKIGPRIRRNHEQTSAPDAHTGLQDEVGAQLAEHFDAHPNQITQWKVQLQESAANVFGPGGQGTAQPAST